MCIYLVHRLYKTVKNADKPQGPNRTNKPLKSKRTPLCEHQLAATNAVNSDGIVGGKNPKHEVYEPPEEPRGAKHCPECITERKRARIYRWKLILSLLVPNMMASMDATITATALPTIASHFCKYTILIPGAC